MPKPYILWPALAGTLFLVGGLVGARRAWSASAGVERLVALFPVFIAAPLATFGGEHMVLASFISQDIPAFMPARLFWAYFVGVALFAAALSLVVRRHMRLSTALLGVMFVLFVAMIHLPKALAQPGDRFLWTVALRELAFAGGVVAFAAGYGKETARPGERRLVTVGRLLVGVALLFFAIQHLLHPSFAPGVPLKKVTPAWFPGGVLLGYLTGAAELVTAAALVVNQRARAAATWLGAWLLLLTVIVYVPLLAAARQSSEGIEGINYVADTLLFAGTMLALAAGLPPAGFRWRLRSPGGASAPRAPVPLTP